MQKNRSQNAWIWVAVAAISLASLARAQSGIENARAYAAPVIKFLSGNQHEESVAAAANLGSGSHASGDAFGLVYALLPICFVGLVFCFSLIPVAWRHSDEQRDCRPVLATLFQRPPPSPLV